MKDHEFTTPQNSTLSGFDPDRITSEVSPIMMSPWNQISNVAKSWSKNKHVTQNNLLSIRSFFTNRGSELNLGSNPTMWSTRDQKLLQNQSIIGSIVHEEGHIYSLAAKSGLLYTGSDSKNIRVWKNMQELSAFKSNSGLVKAIIINKDKIFTGHQDGKVRIWKVNQNNPSVHTRSGSLPSFLNICKSSMFPDNYVEVKRNRTSLWIKHWDAVSSLSICEEHGLLYSASWDRTIKVWSIKNSKCLESMKAHDDAVNSVVASVGGLVYSGSADGSVKVWKRERNGKSMYHTFVQKLLDRESGVNALAVNKSGSFLYCGSSDGVVHFWEGGSKFFQGGVLRGHKLAVLCLATTRKLVFSGSADKNICVWRRDGRVNHSCLAVLTGHDGPVKCLAVEEEEDERGKEFMVYSGSLDKSVRVWSFSERAFDLQQTEQNCVPLRTDHT